jgi:hypothetical protein
MSKRRHLQGFEFILREIIHTNSEHFFLSFLLSFFLSFFLSLTSTPNLCRCRGLLSHLFTLHGTNTLGWTPLDEGSNLRRDLNCNTQHSQAHIHAAVGIRIRNPSSRAAANPHLRPRDHPDRLRTLRCV